MPASEPRQTKNHISWDRMGGTTKPASMRVEMPCLPCHLGISHDDTGDHRQVDMPLFHLLPQPGSCISMRSAQG